MMTHPLPIASKLTLFVIFFTCILTSPYSYDSTRTHVCWALNLTSRINLVVSLSCVVLPLLRVSADLGLVNDKSESSWLVDKPPSSINQWAEPLIIEPGSCDLSFSSWLVSTPSCHKL